MLYGEPRPETNDRKKMITFLMLENLTYMSRLIHNFLFNMVMPRQVGLETMLVTGVGFACTK